MDSHPSSEEPEPRRPCSDAANRKYRRHSRSSGSSSDGSPKHGRKFSPSTSRRRHDHRRHDDMRESRRESDRHESRRTDDSHRHYDRSSRGNRTHSRSDDYPRREHKHHYTSSRRDESSKHRHSSHSRDDDKTQKEHDSKKLKLAESVETKNADDAKVAALKAAEQVNRNFAGVSSMSTEQKKKLLWGNKKATSTDESALKWNTATFGDPERQEKFNKLMGVKGEAKVQTAEKEEEKQKELQMDLERQYTAGLRRRDGRTVGLGL